MFYISILGIIFYIDSFKHVLHLFIKLHSLQLGSHCVMWYVYMISGCMEDGTALGDVELPPWAKSDPQEFIRIHREVSNTWPH